MVGCLVGGKLWSVNVCDDVPRFVFATQNGDGNTCSLNHAATGTEIVSGAGIDSPGPIFFFTVRDGYLTIIESIGFIILVDVEGADQS